MNKSLFLQKAELYLKDKLNRNLFSYELDNSFNEFHTFIYIKVIKSGNFIKIGCSYFDNKLSFWNNFDEEFVQPLTEEGLAEILKTALSEKSVEYSFSFFNDGWAEHSVCLKMYKPEAGAIIQELNKILTESKFKYEHVIFADFFGNINMKIVFNGETQEFEMS